MTDEEYERIKETEKRRLRAKRTLRRLKQALREQQEAGRGALDRMTDRVRALFAEHRSAVDALQWDTARVQARLDTLRDTLTGSTSPSDADVEPKDEGGALDAEDLRRHRAQQLVNDLRTQLDANAPHPSANEDVNDSASGIDAASTGSAGGNASDDGASDGTPDDGLPEKTIGRMPRS